MITTPTFFPSMTLTRVARAVRLMILPSLQFVIHTGVNMRWCWTRFYLTTEPTIAISFSKTVSADVAVTTVYTRTAITRIPAHTLLVSPLTCEPTPFRIGQFNTVSTTRLTWTQFTTQTSWLRTPVLAVVWWRLPFGWFGLSTWPQRFIGIVVVAVATRSGCSLAGWPTLPQPFCCCGSCSFSF